MRLGPVAHHYAHAWSDAWGAHLGIFSHVYMAFIRLTQLSNKVGDAAG